MQYRFIAKEHPEYGELGWQMEGCPGMDPLSGATVAHDILEHFPPHDDSVAGEFMALGAALWIRGESGYFQRSGNINPPEVHIASDVPEIFRHVQDEGYRFPPPPPTRHFREEEEQYGEIRRHIVANLREYEMTVPEQWIDYALDYIRRGYRKAQKRFPDPTTAAYDLFEKIAKAAERIDYEGEIMVVKLVNDKVTVTREDSEWN